MDKYTEFWSWNEEDDNIWIHGKFKSREEALKDPEGKLFNLTPMTITEWICDIVGVTWFFTGFLMALYDANKDSRIQMEQAFKKGADMLREVGVKFTVEDK